MRCARSRSWSTSNTTSTETPCASRWSWTLAAQRRQVSSRARRYCASWQSSARSSGRDRLAVLAQLLGDARQLVKRRVDQQLRAHPLAQLRREAGGAYRAGEEGDGFEERPAPVVRQRRYRRLRGRAPAGPASRRRSRSARRCPGRAERAGRTARRGRSSPASAAAAGRAGGCRTRPRRPVRGAKPKSASSAAVSTSRRNRRSISAARSRCSVVALEHAEQEAQAQHRRRRAAGLVGARRSVVASRAARGAATRPGGSPTGGARRCRPSGRPR